MQNVPQNYLSEGQVVKTFIRFLSPMARGLPEIFHSFWDIPEQRSSERPSENFHSQHRQCCYPRGPEMKSLRRRRARRFCCSTSHSSSQWDVCRSPLDLGKASLFLIKSIRVVGALPCRTLSPALTENRLSSTRGGVLDVRQPAYGEHQANDRRANLDFQSIVMKEK